MVFGKDKTSKKPSENEIEYYFKTNLKLFGLLNMKCSFDDTVRKYGFLNNLVTYIGVLSDGLIGITQIYFMWYNFPRDPASAMKCLSQHMSNINAVCKGIFIMQGMEKVQELFRRLGKIWKNNTPDKEILKEASSLFFFFNAYTTLAILSVISYCLPAVLNFVVYFMPQKDVNSTFDYELLPAFAKHPFPVDDILIYGSLIVVHEIAIFISCIWWLNTDILFASVTTHVSLQFKRLYLDFEELIDKEDDEKKLKNNFTVIIERHDELLSLCYLTEDIFKSLVFSTMLLSSVFICICALEIKETVSRGAYDETGLYAGLGCSTLFQIVFYCIFAERITQQVGLMSTAIYSSKWTEKSIKFRVYIHQILQRAQKSFYCTAYGFFPIGHERLCLIINTSVSYYMMLQTMGS